MAHPEAALFGRRHCGLRMGIAAGHGYRDNPADHRPARETLITATEPACGTLRLLATIAGRK
jgi:hypothetical protein